jgi:hypothetical protein
VDLTDPAAAEAVVQACIVALGVPELVISNAGSGRWLWVEETAPAEALYYANAAVVWLVRWLVVHTGYRR